MALVPRYYVPPPTARRRSLSDEVRSMSQVYGGTALVPMQAEPRGWSTTCTVLTRAIRAGRISTETRNSDFQSL